ncbi:asparaginase domain-containing protein [Halioxenophilus sp. WMMB6]|uniref:asparaginase domain-containing protein n=1 Tax=Halioxenophilus sp. WMMB6 TaxID=3073815 RepID=UPI00295F4378|nr:asparaginase domain-containing protein [Halioxenophilus sp. WMMB6]
MTIQIITTGGTIDKIYFDALSEFQVGESPIASILHEANVTLDIPTQPLFRKDSLELTDADREAIRQAVIQSPARQILITHGTDTMAHTAEVLLSVADKTIVLTGAMQPARLRSTDAIFNVGFALAAVQTLPYGVYIAMNGRLFPAGTVKKNRHAGCFEDL